MYDVTLTIWVETPDGLHRLTRTSSLPFIPFPCLALTDGPGGEEAPLFVASVAWSHKTGRFHCLLEDEACDDLGVYLSLGWSESRQLSR